MRNSSRGIVAQVIRTNNERAKEPSLRELRDQLERNYWY